MANKSDYERGIYRVMHQASLSGAYYTAISDLVFIEGEPHAVLDWGGPQDKQLPLVIVKLEASRLSECRGGAKNQPPRYRPGRWYRPPRPGAFHALACRALSRP